MGLDGGAWGIGIALAVRGRIRKSGLGRRAYGLRLCFKEGSLRLAGFNKGAVFAIVQDDVIITI